MTAEQLKASILQMAIKGKLVPQLDDEPALNIEAVEPEEVPFAIPEKWKWVRLNTIVDVRDGTHESPLFHPQGVPLITSKNLKNGFLDFSNVKYISLEDHTEISKRSRVDTGDILFAMIGTIGNPIIVPQNVPEFSIKNMALIKPVHDSLVDFHYLLQFLKYAQDSMKAVATGGVQSFVSLKFLRNYLIPLPPLAEQRRIVARLNEILPLIEEYGKAHSALKNAEEALPDQLRASLLQEAIQGKLVPQLDDEPAVDMAGEEPDEVPFAIPEKWKWVRIEDVFTLQAGKFIQASEIKEAGTFPCYGGNGLRGYVEKSNRKGRFPLIGRQGALCGNINMADGEFYATEHAVVVDCHEHGDPDCVGYFLRAMNLNQYATATAQPGLAVKNINKLFFPLPPLAEQRRIVARLEALLPHVDAIAGLR